MRSRVVLLVFACLSPSLADEAPMRAYARYSYYTSEAEAQVVCETDLSAPERAAATLVVKDAAGKTLAQTSNPPAPAVLSIPAGALAVGTHALSVELRRRNGVAVVRPVSLIKRAPKPGCEWKVDRLDKVALNNGVPFFPFGIMISARCTTNEEIMIKDIADAGFNSLVRFGNSPFERIEELLDMGKRYGLYVMDFPSMWRYTPAAGDVPPKPDPGTDWRKVASLQFDWHMSRVYVPGMQRIMNHPNYMASYLWDEPQNNEDFAACILKLYNQYNAIDGYHPMEVLYIPPIPEGDAFSRNCDILGTDIYWIPGGGISATDNPQCMSRFTWATRQRADRDLKLAWITPCAEQYSVTRMRLFTEAEQRVQTYLALIHGAKGLLYFVYPFKHQTTYDALARLAKEMKVLGPACAAPDVAQTVHYSPVGFDPTKNVFPDVQVTLKKNPSGGFILLAANWRKYPADVTVKLPGSDAVRPLFGGKPTHHLVEGGFQDSLAAMDTRAYAISGISDAAVPIEIGVEVKAYPDRPDPACAIVGIPEEGAPGKKNILRNSGFEECSIPGMPDYYRDMRTAGTAKGLRCGDPRGDCGWAIDTNRPYEGKQCLRMTGTPGSYSFLLFHVGPKLKEPTPFTFSAWVRGEGDPRATARFYGPETQNKGYPLTNEWQRISQTVTVSPQLPWGGHYFGFYSASPGPCTMWIDAMQFEQGTNSTAYER